MMHALGLNAKNIFFFDTDAEYKIGRRFVPVKQFRKSIQFMKITSLKVNHAGFWTKFTS